MEKALKDRIAKRKIAYIYLLHRMFAHSPALMLKIMRIPDVSVDDIIDWDNDYKEAVYKTIEEEDAKGVVLRDADGDVPSIKRIKDRVLKRCDKLIDETTDPAKLATVYKVLSEFEVGDEKKEKSVLDAINESIKPLTDKQKERKRAAQERMQKLQEQKDRSKQYIALLEAGYLKKEEPADETPEEDIDDDDEEEVTEEAEE